MTESAKKLVYTLQALYEGKGEIKKLSDDLNALKKIEVFQGLQESFNKTNQDFVDAKAKLRALRQEMKQPGGEAFAKAYQAAKENVEKLLTSINKQKQKINDARQGLKGAGVDVTDLAGRYRDLQGASEKTAKVLAAQAKLGVRPLKDVEADVKGLERAYKDLESSGKYSLRELAAAKSKMRGQIAQLREGTMGWRDNLDSVHQGWVGIAGIVATVAATSRGITLFAGFDDSMRAVKAVSGATEEEFVRLTEFAKKLGETTRFTATEAAKGMEELASSGMGVKEIIATLPQAMNIAAISGGTIKESADLVTDTLSQFRLEVGQSGRVTDVLVQGYTGASTSLQQLGEALSYAGPIAAALGYSLEDTVAILQALAEAGFKGSRGGTALVGGLTRVVKPAAEAEAILKKYNIQILDSEGKVRNFADILEDVGKAALNPAEMMTVFGQEAGPGMAGLLGQGSDAIRKFKKELESSGGVAQKIAGDKEAGIGGALRNLGSALEAIVLAFSESWAPMITAVANGLTSLARSIAGMPGPIKVLVSGTALAIAATASWNLGLGLITKSIFLAGGQVLGLAGKLPALIAAITGANVSGAALALTLGKVGLALGAVYAGYKLGEWLAMREHWAEIKQLTEENVRANDKLSAKFKEVSQSTGLTITSMEELDKAVADGLIHYDDAVGKWVAGSGKMADATKNSAATQRQVTDEALEDMKRKYQEYVDEVRRLQDEIAGRQRSLYGELRDLARSGMTDVNAWEDQKAQAEAYMATAKEAAQAGDFDKALAYADEAKSLFKGLRTEIKDGDKVLIGQQEALKAAMDGVKESGELGIEVLKQQQEAAAKAMEELSQQSGFADLKEGMDDAKKQWLENWEQMRGQTMKELDAVDQRIQRIVKDRTMNVYVNTVAKKELGGLAGVLQFAAGGSPFQRLASPYITRGSGTKDDVPALLKRREFVQPEPAVSFWGVDFMQAVRFMQKKKVMSMLVDGFRAGGPVGLSLPPLPPVQMFAGGGEVAPVAAAVGGDTYNLHISGSRDDANAIARQTMSALQRMHRRSSR